MNAIVQLTVKLGDFLLGWLLYLPRDLRLLALAVITTFLMSVMKRLVVNVDWMTRARGDLKELARLRKTARMDKDFAALERYRYTRAVVQLKQLKAEFKTLVVVILPLLIIGTWSWCRMEYYPPPEDGSIEVEVHAPASAIGQVIYIVPADGVQADQRIKVVGRSNDELYPGGVSWTLRVAESEKPRLLLFRTAGITLEQPVITGKKYYQSPLFRDQGTEWRTELIMDEVKLFGVLPGIRSMGIPAWAMAYILLVLLLLPLSRRFLKVS